MAKAKLKREKRALQKLQQAGRHLEWLVAVRELPVTVELKRDIDKAWAEVCRRSLRTREAFEEYCRLRPELGKIPQTPENFFLEALADLIQDATGSTEAVLAVSGLSGAALAAQQHLGKILGQERDWAEVERLLKGIARGPGKVSRKQFQSLGACFNGTGIDQVFEALGEAIMTFRKLNHKTHLNKPLSEGFLADLADDDYLAWSQVAGFPPPLQRLVLLPFVEQVQLHLRQAVPPPGPHQVRALLGSVQHAFLTVAGPHLSDDLREQLSARPQDGCSDTACHKLEQRFAAASFEERLALLRDFRRLVQREVMRSQKELPSFLLSFDGGISEAMERVLIHGHREVVREIGQRLPDLAVRDRRALVGFYDKFLAEDLSLLFMPEADHASLAQLVRQTFEAGCGGARLTLLAPMIATVTSNRQLSRLADQAQQACAALADEDLQWFIDEHLAFALRFPENLRILFKRIGDNIVQAEHLTKAIWEEFTAGSMMDEFADEFDLFMPGADEEKAPMFFTASMLKDLASVAAEVPQLAPLHRFLQAFPTGRVHVGDLRQWCELAWGSGGPSEEFLYIALPLLREACESADLIKAMSSKNIPRKELALLRKNVQQLTEVTDFLRSRTGDFQTLPLPILVTLVEQVFPCLEREKEFSFLLIRTYNVLSARVTAGETACIPLRDVVERRMRSMAGHRR
ncbi:MAG: hypothetical protein AB7U29_04450 [Desulfobulbus sp.]